MIRTYIKPENKKDQLPRGKRSSVSSLILVFDENSDDVIGKIINISQTGLCLIVSEEFISNKQLTVSIPHSSESINSIELELELIWSHKIQSSINYRAGYKFYAKNLKSKQRMSELLKILHER